MRLDVGREACAGWAVECLRRKEVGFDIVSHLLLYFDCELNPAVQIPAIGSFDKGGEIDVAELIRSSFGM